jgi:hypothetical protein
MMKKGLLIASMVLFSFNPVHASILTKKETPPKVQPPPKVLYPKGQIEDETTYLLGFSYLGGAAGQIERRVATSGVSARQATEPTQGSIVSAPTQWMSGFQFDFAVSTPGAGSNLFVINYSVLTGNNPTPETVTTSTTNPTLLPSFATNNVTGATSLVVSVNSQYSLPSLQDGYFAYARSSFANPFLSVLFMGGFHGLSLSHSMYASYTDTSSGVLTYNMQEITYGAGPALGFISSKLISPNFAFRGTFLASAPLCNHSLTQSDLYTDANGNSTFGYNVNSVNQLRQHLVAHLDVEAVFQSNLGEKGFLEFVLSWHVKQYINQSYLTAMLNNQNAPPTTIQVNMLRAGLVFIF